MTDEAKADAAPKLIKVEMNAETRQALAELVAPVTLFSRQQGMPDPGLGDVVGLAVRLMHATVFAKAHDKIAENGVAAPTAMH